VLAHVARCWLPWVSVHWCCAAAVAAAAATAADGGGGLVVFGAEENIANREEVVALFD